MTFDKNYLYAVSIIVGTTIGVGIFGLPYAASKSGFFPAVFLILILGTVTIIMNLMYGEITFRTRKKGRLVGYCEKYLGKKWKKVAAFSILFSLYSALIAYIIVGGIFLNALLFPYFGGNEFIYSLAIFFAVSAGIYASLKFINVAELLMVVLLFIAILVIFVKGFILVDVNNLTYYNFSNSFIPFGVVLFSFSALSAIPEIEHIMGKDKKRSKSAITIGTVIPIIVYILFIAFVVGVTGKSTSEEALTGLKQFIGDDIIAIGLIFGIIAIITSYLSLGINLKEMFWYDYGLSRNKSWALTCFIPLIIFVIGFRSFITIINLAGCVAGGLNGILVIASFYKAKVKGDVKPAYSIKVPNVIAYFMIFIYLIGIAYQLLNFS